MQIIVETAKQICLAIDLNKIKEIKSLNMNRATKPLLLAAALLALLISGYVGATSVGLAQNLMKITDPDDPNFNLDRFSFHDYGSKDELADALKKLFPVGTPKSLIDRVLVDAGGAKPSQSKTHPQLWHYWAPLPLMSRNRPV